MEAETKKHEDLLETLERERDAALERVVDMWLDDHHDPEELHKAIDVLTVAHMKAALDFLSGSFSS
jgi:hypothetical protein